MASKFVGAIKTWGAKALVNVETVAKGSVAEVSDRVLDRSPRLSGAFVGNWQIGDQSFPFNPDVTDLAGAFTKTLIRTDVMQTPLRPFYRLRNPAPYGLALEYGSSKQAPEGMVRISAVEWPAIVEAQAKEVRR